MSYGVAVILRILCGIGAFAFMGGVIQAYLRLTQMERPTKRYARDYFDMEG